MDYPTIYTYYTDSLSFSLDLEETVQISYSDKGYSVKLLPCLICKHCLLEIIVEDIDTAFLELQNLFEIKDKIKDLIIDYLGQVQDL